MLINIVVFINMFFVPVLPLYFIYRKNQRPIQFHFEMLLQYCIIAACNIPCTKVFVFLTRRFCGKSISMDSGYYTLLALATAFLIYALYEFHKAHPDKQPWIRNLFLEFLQRLKKKHLKGVFNDLVPAFLIMFAGCFMLFFFEPILVYSTNIDDFWFDLKIMIWPVLGMFACFLTVGFLMLFAIYICNLLFAERLIVYKGIVLASFICFFLMYLQGNWLSGNLPDLTGEKIIWGNYGKVENIILISAFIVLSVVLLVCVSLTGLDRVLRYAAMGMSVIFIMLFSSLIPTVIAHDAFRSKDSFSASTENFNTVSSNKNFLIFLVDTVDSRTFYNMMNNDDDFRGMFEDFTYYPDTLSTYAHTRDSIPNILTGAVNYNEIDFAEYCSSAYNQSPFFKKLVQNAYTINLYSTSISWEGERRFPVENAISIHDTKVDFIKFIKQEIKYISFKYFPYAIKKYSRIETLDFDLCQIINGNQFIGNNNQLIYNSIQNNKNLNFQNENYFQFIHSQGAHTPFNMDKYLNSIKDGTYEDKVAASLTMIKAYLQRLKDNNAYDNSAIVIMADHGKPINPNLEQPYFILSRCNPILFIKGINEKHDFQESTCPISYLDLQDAFCDLIDGKQTNELFPDIESGRTRIVMWQETWKKLDIVEYATNGKANEVEKFFPTGNVYDLKN